MKGLGDAIHLGRAVQDFSHRGAYHVRPSQFQIFLLQTLFKLEVPQHKTQKASKKKEPKDETNRDYHQREVPFVPNST